MPLPQPYGGGILGGLGNFFAGIGGAMNPAINQNNMTMQSYGALAQDPNFGPNNAAMALSNPNALQQKIFMDQLQSMMQANPGMSYQEALYKMSEQGQKEQYGYVPGQPIKGQNGVEIPTYIHGGQPILGIPGQGGNAVGAGQTAQPPTTPSGTNQRIETPTQGGMPTNLQGWFDYFRNEAAKNEAATTQSKTEATQTPGFAGALNQAQHAVQVLQDLDKDPGLGDVVGGTLAWRGRLTPDIGGHRADTINAINTAQGKVLIDAFSSLRSAQGRPMNAGALKELVAGFGDLQGDRYGTLPAFHGDVSRIIQQISDEADAAWSASGKPAGYEPGSIAKTAFAPQSSSPQRIANDQEHAKLKSGTQYFAPDGSLRTKK